LWGQTAKIDLQPRQFPNNGLILSFLMIECTSFAKLTAVVSGLRSARAIAFQYAEKTITPAAQHDNEMCQKQRKSN
jgi:hypothetical protein